MNRQKALTAALAALLVLLLWDFGSRALLYSPLAPASNEARPDIPAKQENADGLVQAWGPEIEKKDLFSKTRSTRISPVRKESRTVTPASTQPAQPAPAPEVRPDLTLSGIIKNQFGEYVAYIILNGQEPVSIRKGEMIGEATVTYIDNRSVTLDWKGSDIRLSLSSQPLIKR